jgi:hypothetical protein
MSWRRKAALGGLAIASFAAFVDRDATAASAALPGYDVFYEARLGRDCIADVRILVEKNPKRLRELRIRTDPKRHYDFAGDGRIARDGDVVVWSLPPDRGELRYRVRIDHRKGKAYDAHCNERWALFRGEDLFPPTATVVVPEGTPSRASFKIDLPNDWKVVTPFRKRKDGTFKIEQSHRDHDRPTGWILAGKLGVNREEVAGVRLTIASPVGQDVHRLDLMALLRWTLPELHAVAGELPGRLLVVSARAPMWRGGLSGPESLYLHGDRPLIQRDGTSPLLHEVLHVLMGARAGSDGDWVVEGLAEYYSLVLLHRTKTISESRYRKSLEKLASEGAKVTDLRVDHSTGATTARAADVLQRLDQHVRAETSDRKSLDDVLRALVAADAPITTDGFQRTAENATGLDLEAFFRENVADGKPRPAASATP